jgi:hypothetical protein
VLLEIPQDGGGHIVVVCHIIHSEPSDPHGV